MMECDSENLQKPFSHKKVIRSKNRKICWPRCQHERQYIFRNIFDFQASSEHAILAAIFALFVRIAIAEN